VNVNGVSVYCYRVSGEGMDTLAVGDTVKVEGYLTAYNGSAQFDKTATVTVIAKATVE
jgi:predicted extracellular nuclease